MKSLEYLPLAALLHDIGKFRMRHTHPNTRHQEHSYAFVNEDFSDFFSSCGDAFRDAIRHHHPERYPECHPTQLPHLIEKLVILADRLSATEREDEEREREYFGQSALVSPLSRLKGSEKEYRYPLTALNLDRSTVIPADSVEVDQDAYTALWKDFTAAFGRLTAEATYSPASYQTIVALLRKYTSRMPSSTPWGRSDERTDPDISLYDHLRTTAAIAACLGRELTEDTDIDALLCRREAADTKICTLIKGDLSGIQNFLYQILSDRAARQLRGRSFYLQLLTEAIAQWILRYFDLPITNLLLSSGGHFYILAPYREAEAKLDRLRERLSEKLWRLHQGDLACILGDIPITAADFSAENFADKWESVGGNVHRQKQQKWLEMGAEGMYEHLFTPYKEASDDWKFDELGRHVRDAKYLIAFEVEESPIPASPDWQSVMQAFGLEIHLRSATDEKPPIPHRAERAIVYDLREQGFLTDEVLGKFQWDGVPVSYDFRTLPKVIARKPDGDVADYDALTNASEGAKWLGVLRMDVDNLGTVFKEKLQHPTLSRVASLSENLRHFFEGYVPEVCRQYNAQQQRDILELIYAGGDDLFLVGGWSALPEIARRIRCEFREFVTSDHVTLSGGIAMEHRKFPLYQFAEQSGNAERAAKALDGKNGITFLRKPMAWSDFENVREWHEKFLSAMSTDRDQLPSACLTRLHAIYADEKKWAWRSIYYFSRLKERYRTQAPFLDELRQALNHETSSRLRDVIDVITRWTALRVRNKED